MESGLALVVPVQAVWTQGVFALEVFVRVLVREVVPVTDLLAEVPLET